MKIIKLIGIILVVAFVFFLFGSGIQNLSTIEQVSSLNSQIINLSKDNNSLNIELNTAKQFFDSYCKDFNETTDIAEIRELARSYLIAKINNAEDIIFEDILLVGDNCNARWWTTIKFTEKINDAQDLSGYAVLTIDAVTKDLREFSASYGESCSHTWAITNVIGETKHEASKTIPANN